MAYDIIVGRTDSDRKAFGTKGTIFLGKHYVRMGETVSLSNRVLLDIARTHVILVSGKRGSGKCLHGDTLITLADGSIKPIKELENDNNEVLSLDERLKLKKAKKTEFFKRKVNELIKIKLRSGKEIKLTPEHPLLTIKGWKPVQELNLGSRIATPRNINLFNNANIPDFKIKLLAYLIAEGHIRKSWVLFSNSDNEIINDLKECVLEFDKNMKVDLHSKAGCYRIANKNNRYSFRKNKIKIWLKEVGLYGLYSTEKFIPQEVFKSNKEKTSLFLNRLFSCDGSIYYNKHRNGWEIDYSSSSKKLIIGVQHLLLRFGIVSKLREKRIRYNNQIKLSFELVLGSENIQKFIENIGFFGEKEKKEKICLKEISQIKRNPNVDTIPREIWDVYKPANWARIGRFVGYAHPKAMRERIRYCPSRETLLQIAKADNNESLRLLSESDIFWDEIISMEKLEGDFEVYDLCVPELHNFIANDIIVHNSYSLSVIAEEMAKLPDEISKNLAILMFDTMGVFWTMKYPNERDEKLLEKWDLKPESLNINLYVPEGYYQKYKERNLPADFSFSIKTSELNAGDWANVFDVKINDPIGVLIERVIEELGDELKDKYDIDDIIEKIGRDKRVSQTVKDAAENRFLNAKRWGLFSVEGTEISGLIKRGQISVIDTSAYTQISGAWSIKSLVLGIIARKLLTERIVSRRLEELENIETSQRYLLDIEKELEKPLIWLMIDECLPYDSIVETDKGKIEIGNLINRVDSGEEIKIKGYDEKNDSYGYYKLNKTFKIEPRKLIELKTETGKKLKCTSNHPVLTKDGFINASLTDSLAFPLETNYGFDKRLILARLVGHILGDGYLTKMQLVGFCGKGNKDLGLIKRDLDLLGIKSSKIYERITRSKIVTSKGKINHVVGLSQEMRSGRKAFRFFKDLGLPVGKKTECSFSVPEFILNGSKEEKAEFLAALLGSDGYGLTNANNSKADFNAIRLSFNKIEEIEKNGWDYANQIVKLFEDLGVNVSSIKKVDGNIRVDRKKTVKFIITLKKDIENTIRFIEKIGFRYNTKKEINSRKWLAYLRYYREKLEKYNKLRDKAIEMHKKERLGKIKIARILGIENYRVREWIYYGRKARIGKELESFDEFISKRVKSKVLHEKVEEINILPSEPLYDIEVDKVHNFIADETIVHNCHEFLPKHGSTPATDALIQLLREGRQPGISLVMATQQPGEIHKDVLTQSDIVLSHRLTAKADIEALNSMMQSYLLAEIQDYMNGLPNSKGSAIILDDNSERIYPIAVRPKLSWHGGEAPSAVKFSKKDELKEL